MLNRNMLQKTDFHHFMRWPVEFVESQFDLRGVGFPIAALVTEDLFDAADPERVWSVQVWALDVVWRLPVIFWIKLLIHVIFPMGAFHRAGWFNTGLGAKDGRVIVF